MEFIELFTNTYIVQIIGFVGVAISLISFQFKDYQKLMWMRVLCEFVFALQYFLLGAYTGMATNLLSCVTNSIYCERIKRNRSVRTLQILFVCMFALTGILTWHGWASLFVIFAKGLSSFANGLGDSKKIRFLNLFVMSLWVAYDIAVFSIGGVVNDLLAISSIIIAFSRLDKKGNT